MKHEDMIFQKFHCQHSLTEAWTNFYMIWNFPCYCNLCKNELIADSMVAIHMVHGNVTFKNMTWFGSSLVIVTSANKNPKLIRRLKMHLWRKHVRKDEENVTNFTSNFIVNIHYWYKPIWTWTCKRKEKFGK